MGKVGRDLRWVVPALQSLKGETQHTLEARLVEVEVHLGGGLPFVAAVGLYGLMAHLVGLRRRELGIRLQLR